MCTIEGCDKPLGRGRARYCEMHYYRLRRHGDPHHHRPNWNHRGEGPNWDTKNAYYQAHRKVTEARGAARTHACVDCGNPAKDWSLAHERVTDVRQGLTNKGINRPYSIDVSDYDPRCKSCHTKYDNNSERA